MVACRSLLVDLFGGRKSVLPGGGTVKVPDLFLGSRSDLPGGGRLECSVERK